MARHHFVPQFLLDLWASQGKLVSYCWIQAKQDIVVGNPTVRGSCEIKDLYAFYGLPSPGRDQPEQLFFTPMVDTPAAEAHRVILRDGIRGLTDQQRLAWARFLVAFPARTPETMRLMGPAEFRKAMEKVSQVPRGTPEEEARVTEIIEQLMPSLERNVVIKIATDLAADTDKAQTVASMDWWTCRLDRKRILIGDRPLLSNWPPKYPCGIPLDRADCLIVLPVAPDVVFFASADLGARQRVRRTAPGKLARVINSSSVQAAVEFVFAHDRSAEKEVRKVFAIKINGISNL